MLSLFFVHIPKTAGTSFRKACENYFGTPYSAYDYSPNSSDTSALVLDCMYRNHDFLLFF